MANAIQTSQSSNFQPSLTQFQTISKLKHYQLYPHLYDDKTKNNIEEHAHYYNLPISREDTNPGLKTAIREEIAAETEPAALLALHQSAAIAERERSATPTPAQTPREKAFERIALERAGQPQPEPEPTGLELEERGFGQSNWTPTITHKDAFLRRGHYIEGTLPQDSMFFVDNRKETHTEEGRPMIWGSKDELEERIRAADISEAKQRKALSGLQKGMIKNRSYWSNDKQILKALGFQ